MTETDYICFCPFHSNRNSPSFSISKDSGLYMCFSAACEAKGNVIRLVQEIGRLNYYAALRYVEKHQGAKKPLSEQYEDLLKKREKPTFDVEVVNRMASDIWGSPGQEYMHSRGIVDETIAYFQIGYSQNRDMIALPVHDWDGTLVGVIGRSLESKVYKNSKGLHTKDILFNAHRAKKFTGKAIVTESAMDVLRLHQLGFKGAMSTNGGFFTQRQKQILDRHFDEIVIMTDFDNADDHRKLDCKKCHNTCLGHNPGRALGEKIAREMQHKTIRWAAYDHLVIYPHGAKDPGEMTDSEIIQSVNNSITSVEYEYWKKVNDELARV